MDELKFSKSKQLSRKPKRITSLKLAREEYQWLVKKADTLFSRIIRTIYPKSVYSGETRNLHCSHLVSRRYYKYRWDVRNAISLTQEEHLYGWHKDPNKWLEWLQKSYPDKHKEWEEMHFDARNVHNDKPSLEEMKETCGRLERLAHSLGL